MIVDNDPETIMLGDLDCSLSVRLAIDTHVIVVDSVGTVRVKINSDGIVALSLHLDQQQLHV